MIRSLNTEARQLPHKSPETADHFGSERVLRKALMGVERLVIVSERSYCNATFAGLIFEKLMQTDEFELNLFVRGKLLVLELWGLN